MVVGVCRIDLLIRGNDNLKDKRRLSQSIVSRMKRRYNVSVAEVDLQDDWRHLVLGVSYTSNQASHAKEVLNHIVRWVETSFDVELTDYLIEIL